MSKKLVLIIILKTLLFSCNNNQRDNLDYGIEISETNDLKEQLGDSKIIDYEVIASERLRFSEVIKRTELIPLETSEESMIGKIDKLICTDSLFIILDVTLSKAVFCFDHSGKFLFKFGSNGKGPGEYLIPRDVNLISDQSIIEILDNSQRKIIRYSLTNEFISEVSIPMTLPYLNFLRYEPDSYLMSTGNFGFYKDYPKIGFNLMLVDSVGKILSRHGQFQEGNSFIVNVNHNSLSKGSKGVLYAMPWANTVLCLNNGFITKKYRVDFGSKGVNHRIIKDFDKTPSNTREWIGQIDDFQGFIRNEGYLSGPYGCVDTQKVICFECKGKGNPLWIFLSKETGKLISSERMHLDMQLGYALPQILPISKKGEQMVGAIYPAQLFENMRNIKRNKSQDVWENEMTKFKRYKNLLENTSIGDNPILAISELRDF